MARVVQRRRGTTLEHSTFIGANGEITVDTDKHVAVIHDGETAGGFPQLGETGRPGNIVQSETVLQIVTLTQQEYDALSPRSATTLYFIVPLGLNAVAGSFFIYPGEAALYMT